MSLVVQITQDEAGSQTLPGGRRGKGGEEEEGERRGGGGGRGNCENSTRVW